MHLALPKGRSNFVVAHHDVVQLGFHIRTHHGRSTKGPQFAETFAVGREAEAPVEEVVGCSQEACIVAVLAFGVVAARNCVDSEKMKFVWGEVMLATGRSQDYNRPGDVFASVLKCRDPALVAAA